MQRFWGIGFLFMVLIACRTTPIAPSQNRASVYRSGTSSPPPATPAPIIPGAPDVWICEQPGLDSLFLADSIHQTFALRYTWENETFAMAGFADSSLVIFRLKEERKCDLVSKLSGIPCIVSIHAEDINQDQKQELWLYGRADEYGNTPTHIFFLQQGAITALPGPLFSPEVLHDGRGLVCRFFDHRCSPSRQDLYTISPDGKMKLTESLTFQPDCAADSAQAILSYPGEMGKSLALPIVGTRRMVFDIFKSFYE